MLKKFNAPLKAALKNKDLHGGPPVRMRLNIHKQGKHKNFRGTQQ